MEAPNASGEVAIKEKYHGLHFEYPALDVLRAKGVMTEHMEDEGKTLACDK